MGLTSACFEAESRYVQERVQFGVPIGNSQLVQEKMMRMAGNVQAMRLLAIRVSELLDSRKLSSGQAALAKAWNTLRGRECAALAREILGGGLFRKHRLCQSTCVSWIKHPHSGCDASHRQRYFEPVPRCQSVWRHGSNLHLRGYVRHQLSRGRKGIARL